MNLEKKELQQKKQQRFKFSSSPSSSSGHHNKHYKDRDRPPSHELMTQTTVAIGADRMKQQQQTASVVSVS